MEKNNYYRRTNCCRKDKFKCKLAKELQGEIISGDSMQVYKEMSIGTAKVKEEEKEGIPHHLVDCYSFDEEYNVKIFQEKAREEIKKMHEKGILPIICGGTGLYIKSMLYDYQLKIRNKMNLLCDIYNLEAMMNLGFAKYN